MSQRKGEKKEHRVFCKDAYSSLGVDMTGIHVILLLLKGDI